MDVVKLVSEFGFPVVMVVGLGYFVYFVWQTINTLTTKGEYSIGIKRRK